MGPCNNGRATARIALIALLVVAAPSSDRAGSDAIRPVHIDGAAVVETVVAATRAYLAEDPQLVRASLDRLKELSPPLNRDDDAVYGSDLLAYDQAFHTTIDRAREYATPDRLGASFDQFVWVQRACRTCHGLARDAGFLPAVEPQVDQSRG